MALNVSDPWNVTPYSLVNQYRWFTVKFCRPLQDTTVMKMATDHSFRLPVIFNQTKRHHISEDNFLTANSRATDSGFGPTAREQQQGNKVSSAIHKMAADRRGGQYDKSVPNYISCYRERQKPMRHSKGPKSPPPDRLAPVNYTGLLSPTLVGIG